MLGWMLLSFGLPFALMALLTPRFVLWLKRLSLGQYIREDGPASHQKKQGTPTGGGLLMLGVATVSIVLIAVLNGPWVTPTTQLFVLALVVLWILGGLGLMDDGLKILKKNNKGVTGYTKLAVQALVGLLVGWALYGVHGGGTIHILPKLGVISLGLAGYMGFAMLVVVATSNAVNLTDGLDGLAAGCALISFLTLAAIAAWWGGWGILTLVALVMAGTVTGFLLYNRHPARVFMGDSGSLALGGMVALIALAARVEWLILLFGVVFVIEALSVVIQVVVFKGTGKRFFRMAPYHHHLELGGLGETIVVRRLWTVQLVGALLTGLFLML